MRQHVTCLQTRSEMLTWLFNDLELWKDISKKPVPRYHRFHNRLPRTTLLHWTTLLHGTTTSIVLQFYRPRFLWQPYDSGCLSSCPNDKLSRLWLLQCSKFLLGLQKYSIPLLKTRLLVVTRSTLFLMKKMVLLYTLPGEAGALSCLL